MAVADLIKAFSLSESGLRSSSSSTTTHVVGFLSVLAISGSVALFALAGKLRLPADASEPLKLDCRTKSGPLDEAASEPLKMNGRDGLIREGEATSAPSKMDGGDRVQAVKACRKRVRFADDVVEPRGNGHEYRMRFEERQHEESVGRSKRHPSNSIPANRMALYRGLRQHRLQHAASFYS